MSEVLMKMAAKRVMGSQMKKYRKKEVGGPTDPYFTQVVNPRTGKVKKMKKQVPDYIPEHDAVILAKMRNRSYKLDMCLFNVAGVRFGWSSVIGIVPAFGDAADALLALLLVWRCSKIECGLGSVALVSMLLNVLLDFVIGIVPILGDLADAAFKANTRNVRVLEKRLDEVYKPNGLKSKDAEARRRTKEERRKSGMPYEEHYEFPPATVLEELSENDDEDVEAGRTRPAQQMSTAQPPRQGGTTTTRVQNQQQQQPTAPPPVAQPAGNKSGWFSGFRGSSKPNPEAGTGERPPPPSTRPDGHF